MIKKVPINIYYASIEDSNFAKQWLVKLETYPTFIISHCQKFFQEADQKRRLLGYWLLEQLLIDNGFEKTLICDIRRDTFHKPFFKNQKNLFFSLSYSKELAICAISNDPIGIDIEKINTEISLEHYKSVFSDEAWAQIINSENPITAFFSFWTQMEAVMKIVGQGVAGATNQIKFGNHAISINNIEREIIFVPTLDGYSTHLAGTNTNATIVKRKYLEM